MYQITLQLNVALPTFIPAEHHITDMHHTTGAIAEGQHSLLASSSEAVASIVQPASEGLHLYGLEKLVALPHPR